MNTNEEMKTKMDNTDTTRTASDSPKNGESKPKKKTPHNKIVGYILSIIAFAFAIASFWTTKKGMQDYIFEDAIGVFISFGVQAMLFCLSMTIPKYWRVLRTLAKTIMSITLIILITISSGFTYVYAVEDVYKSTKFINSGNSIVQQHSKELKDAKEYVDAAMKYYRLKMSETISEISVELNLSSSADPNESATPTAMPEATPTPSGTPYGITTPERYPSIDEEWMPRGVFAYAHDYPDTNITVIFVANRNEWGDTFEDPIETMYFDNRPATVAECNEQEERIDVLIERYEAKRDNQIKYAEDESNQLSDTPRDKKINRYQANADQYDKVVIKLNIIKSNIALVRTDIEGSIDNKANGLLAEMLKEQNADEIIKKVNELKDFVMQKQETLDRSKFAKIANLLQQISIIADDYKALMDSKTALDKFNIDYSDYLNKVANKQKEDNDSAKSEASDTAKPATKPKATSTAKPTATPEDTPTAKPTPTPEDTPTAKPTATPEVTATVAPEDDNTATPEATSTTTSEVDATASPEANATATSEATATVESTPTPTDWYDYSNKMLAELAAKIRRIPRVELPNDDDDNDDDDGNEDDDNKDLLKEINLTKEYFEGYDPIERADKLQDMIRNEIGDINLLEKAFRRLFYENYNMLALATLIVAFVCDLTALVAGYVNNSLAIHNLNPKRAVYKAAIEDMRETRKGEARMNRLQLKKNRIERRHEVRTAVQNKLWNLWERFLVFLHLCEDESTEEGQSSK